MHRFILATVFLFASCNAEFVRLREVCRSSDQELGWCTHTDFCCRAIGGRVVDDSGVSSRSHSLDVLLARSAQDQGASCSYDRVCCIVPVPEDHNCRVCGIKGNNDVSKDRPEFPRARRTTTTPEPPIKKISPRVVNGEDADENEWCWHVTLLNRTGIIGGGALISRNYVATVCHTIAGLFVDEFIVALNLHNFAHQNKDTKVYYAQATRVAVHPNFNPSNYDNNICLIRIPDAPCNRPGVCTICLPEDPKTFEPVTTTTSTTTTGTVETTTTTTTTTGYYGSADPNPLLFSVESVVDNILRESGMRVINPDGSTSSVGGVPVQENPHENLQCMLTGFGATGSSAVSAVLQEAPHQIISPQQCQEDFAALRVPEGRFVLPANNSICSRGPEGVPGTCIGDGGGPLVCRNPTKHWWELCGLIQLGLNMCMQDADNGPTIHVNVAQYNDWIAEVVVEASLPDGGNPERKDYKVPECGENVEKPCPEKPKW